MSNQQILVLTVTGSDRPGLVEAISKVLSEHQANWEASHLARIGGRFAGILQVAVDVLHVAALLQDLDGLAKIGLTIRSEKDLETPEPEGQSYSLSLVGSDQPNIVHEIASVLAKREVSVLEIRSGLSDAPVSGGRLFTMQASIRCPATVSAASLRDSLEVIANSLMVDLTIED